MLKKLLVALCVLALVMTLGLIQGCSENENPVVSVSSLDIERAISLLVSSQVSLNDQAYLNNLSDSDWDLVAQEIEKRGIKFIPEGYVEEEKKFDVTRSALANCPWDGTTRWNSSLTRARGYRYQGHYAVYFTVDANACCYSKNIDYWLTNWSPTHGSVHNWYLLLDRDRYWSGSKWVKDVVLLVPKSWWWIYPYFPSSFKAGRFYIRWYHQNNGCCE